MKMLVAVLPVIEDRATAVIRDGKWHKRFFEGEIDVSNRPDAQKRCTNMYAIGLRMFGFGQLVPHEHQIFAKFCRLCGATRKAPPTCLTRKLFNTGNPSTNKKRYF